MPSSGGRCRTPAAARGAPAPWSTRAAGQDDALRAERGDLRPVVVPGPDFAVHADLADARAISCVYCAPKSRMRILSWMLVICSCGVIPNAECLFNNRMADGVVCCCFRKSKAGVPAFAGSFAKRQHHPPVVRRFGDLHVVHVALALPAPVITNCGFLRISSMVAQPT